MIRNALGFLANDLCVSRIVRLRFVNYGKSFPHPRANAFEIHFNAGLLS
jgi:hypothetical protein